MIQALHPLALHNPEAIGDEGQVGEAGVARWIQPGDVVVRIGGGEIDRHAHQVAGHRGAGIVVGRFGVIKERVVQRVDV